MSREQRSPLEWLAIEVAAAAPEQFSIHGTKAYVPRPLIESIRKECDRAGIDWRKVRRERQAKKVQAATAHDEAGRPLTYWGGKV